MTNCKYITKNGRCGLKGSYAYRHGCFGEDMCRCREPMTNAQRIRAMSDEELVKMLWKTGRNYRAVCADPVVDFNEYHDDLLDWLQQPAGEEDKHETD